MQSLNLPGLLWVSGFNSVTIALDSFSIEMQNFPLNPIEPFIYTLLPHRLTVYQPSQRLPMKWYNEPPFFEDKAGVITIVSGDRTDFWRKTHYNFIRDSGHFYYTEFTGDFMASVKISGQYKALYDQAGLMLRLNEKVWLKTGIEFVNNVQQVSAVVTRDYSDWSVIPLLENPASLWLRLQRNKGTVEIQYSLDGKSYTMLRMAYLTEEETLQVGLMCASPESEGFQVKFEDFKLE